MPAIGQPLMLAHWIVAGLDAGRFHWSNSIPFTLQIGGLIGFAVSMGLAFWAMAVNPFFSPLVRIQTERGHRLITEGPYRCVRHPGYLGGIVGFLCSGLALGSWWSLLPMGLLDVLILRRTVLEDRFLRDKLEG
jgi:protein-S-isoprenylcysteine O-methyltransferase Ste14